MNVKKKKMNFYSSLMGVKNGTSTFLFDSFLQNGIYSYCVIQQPQFVVYDYMIWTCMPIKQHL